MSTQYAFAKTITNNLMLVVDAGDVNCYVSGSLIANNLAPEYGPYATCSIYNGVGFSRSNGGYFTFDGSNDYIQHPFFPISGSNKLTMEAWVYQTVGSKNSNILVYDGNSGARMRIDSANRFWALAGNAGSFTTLNTTITLSQNTWYHLVASIASNAFFLYVNGVQQASNTSLTFNPSNGTGYDTTIGGYTFSENFTGRIALARAYYNYNLSASEVLYNYNAQKSRFGL